MKNILYPTHRRSVREPLWVCDDRGAAEWSDRKPAHERPARRDAWGKRATTPTRPATATETKAGVQAFDAAA